MKDIQMVQVEESLTGRVIAAHGDIVRKLHNVEEAQRARDAFTKVRFSSMWQLQETGTRTIIRIVLKLVGDTTVPPQAMYDRLFSWIVSQVNAAIDPSTTEVRQPLSNSKSNI